MNALTCTGQQVFISYSSCRLHTDPWQNNVCFTESQTR